MTQRLTISLPDETAGRLDYSRGLVPRSAFLADLIDKHCGVAPPVAPKVPQPVTADPAPRSAPPIPGSEEHTHTWRRFSNLLDDCECGADRNHVPGTR